MIEASILVAIGGAPGGEEGANPLGTMFLPIAFFLIIYFVMLRPMQAKQKKLDALVSALKPKDKVVLNPGILGEIVSLEEKTLVVRVDANTKIRVLRSAVAGLQEPVETESK